MTAPFILPVSSFGVPSAVSDESNMRRILATRTEMRIQFLSMYQVRAAQ